MPVMDRQHLARLSSCLEIAHLLTDPRKNVEDDTSLQRIITAVETILNKSSEIFDISNHLSLLDKAWDVIKLNIRSYCCSSICYLLKLSAVLLVHVPNCATKWGSLLKFIANFPKLDSDVQLGEFQHGKWFSPSVGFSWLFAIKSLILVPEIFAHISSDLNLHHIVLLCEAPSIFVQKEASDCMAKIGLELLKVNKSEMRRLYDAFTDCLMKQLTLTKVVIIITKMLLIGRKHTIGFLSETSFSEYFILHNSELLECCKHGEMFLTNFYEALFTSESMESHIMLSLEKVLRIEDALAYSITALTHNPTKHVVWRMFTSLLSHHPTLEDSHFEMAIPLITYPLDLLFAKVDCVCTDNKDHTKWVEVVKRSQTNRAKMTAILSNCLSSIPAVWKFCKKFDDRNLPQKILKLLCWIGSKHQPTDRDLPLGIQENWKVATSLLNLIEQCFFKLSRSELNLLCITILAMLENSNINHTMYCLCQRVASCIIETACDDFQFVERCVDLASRKLLDRRWEMRDSSLDHLSSLILSCTCTSMEVNERILEIYAHNNIYSEVLRLAGDKNGFVRANALMLMKSLLEKTSLCDMTNDNTLDLILNIITKDTEGITRRAAVHTLLSYLKREKFIVTCLVDAFSSKKYENFTTENIESNMNKRAADAVFHALYEDLDWEVKYNAVDILEYLVSYFNDINISEKNKTCQESINLCFESHFKKLFDDYDAAVRDKSKNVHSLLFPVNLAADSDTPSTKNGIDVQIFQDMDDLLDEVLVSLRKDKQIRLTHGCHGPPMNGDGVIDLEYDDSVILDCY